MSHVHQVKEKENMNWKCGNTVLNIYAGNIGNLN